MTLSHFGRGGYSASVIEAVFGIGMMAGGVVLALLASRWKDSTYMSLSLVLIEVTCLLSGVIGRDAFVLFAILCFFMGAAAPLFNGPYMAMLQKLYEPEKLGRVLSFVTSIGLLCSPIGLALAGPIVERFGVQVWFVGAGVVVILIGCFIYLQYGRMEEERPTVSL